MGWAAAESNWFTVTTVFNLAVGVPSQPIASTEIVASPKKPSSQSATPVRGSMTPALGGAIYQLNELVRGATLPSL